MRLISGRWVVLNLQSAGVDVRFEPPELTQSTLVWDVAESSFKRSVQREFPPPFIFLNNYRMLWFADRRLTAARAPRAVTPPPDGAQLPTARQSMTA
jgi:hypothetical protein